MKIAFITTMGGFQWGGSEELWCRTAEYALKQGHNVFVAVYDHGNLHPKVEALVTSGAKLFLRKRNLRALTFLERGYQKIQYWFLSYRTLFVKLKEYQPDVICISNGGTYNALTDREVSYLIKVLDKPYVNLSQFNFEHKVIDDHYLDAARVFFKKAKYTLFVSQRNLQVAKRQLAMELDNAYVVCNPLNLPKNNYSMVEMPAIEMVHFACVARLQCDFKGQDILFQVLSDAKWKARSWVLNLYGEGPDEKYLRSLAIYYDLATRVNFCGHVTDIRMLWKKNHILVLPSLGEGTPLSLLEAMVCGRPAVVTDVGGNAEFIEEALTGFIAKYPTSSAINAALEKAWHQQEHWHEMGQKAHEIALKKIDFQPEKVVLNYITD